MKRSLRYVGDILTASRIVISIGLVVWSFLGFVDESVINYRVALWLAVYSFLSDALDGIAARRWPYSDEERQRIPWHRSPELSHAFDNAGDSLLYLATGLVLATHDRVWLLIVGIALGGALTIFIVIENLARRRSPWAETVDVIFGWLFGTTFGTMVIALAIVALPSNVWPWVVSAGCVVAIAFIPFKWDRLTTRPERHIDNGAGDDEAK